MKMQTVSAFVLLSSLLLLVSGHPDGGRVVGGEVATDGEFPWMVSLRMVGSLGITHFCGGAVIDKDWVMTAASCCINMIPATLHIVAGGIELINFEHEEQTRNLRRIISHPEFERYTKVNDICLLQLQESLVLNEWVTPLALPPAGQETETGTTCTLSGWGNLHENDYSNPNKLHKVEIPIVSDEDCASVYLGTNPFLASMICAGGLPEGGRDACTGDLGSPLVQGGESVGIASWTSGPMECGRPGLPGVYTQTSHFVDWIMETMADN